MCWICNCNFLSYLIIEGGIKVIDRKIQKYQDLLSNHFSNISYTLYLPHPVPTCLVYNHTNLRGSTNASRYIVAAVCPILSNTGGIHKVLCTPVSFGIATAFTGSGK